MVNILLLISVLILGTGEEETGGKSWIRFGKIGIQPAEIVKIGFILAFSYQLDKYKGNINSLKSVSLSLIHIAVLVGLIMLQPDFGTTMVFIAMFAAMLFVAKISYKYVVAALLAIPPVFAALWVFVFKDFQKNRIINFINPATDTQLSGYQAMQSKTAIGAGKIFGQGLFKGILTQNDLLPAKHTDFIFAVAGEELGFVGALVILALIVFIVVRCYIIAYNAKDSLGAFIGIGVGTMILVQSFENIGMTVGLTPITGITLPFLSYGGSSMVTNYLAIGLVLNVKVRHKKINFL
jgi:rod shape determining protein RodA